MIAGSPLFDGGIVMIDFIPRGSDVGYVYGYFEHRLGLPP